MTLLSAHVPPKNAEVSLEAIKARVVGKTAGELLGIRTDIAEQLSHFDSAPNDHHADWDYVRGRERRDMEMERVARLRAEFAYLTDLLESGSVKT